MAHSPVLLGSTHFFSRVKECSTFFSLGLPDNNLDCWLCLCCIPCEGTGVSRSGLEVLAASSGDKQIPWFNV